MTADHRALRELLGAYVLDQLIEPDVQRVRNHLAGCPDCRAEVANLQPVVSALRDYRPSTGRGVLTHPRPAGRRVLAGALVAASIGGAFAAGSLLGRPADDPPVIAVALETVAPGVRADAGLVRHTWGTELKLEATGLDDGASYTVTFVGADGSRVAGGSFLGTGDEPVRCSVNAALATDSAAELLITDSAGQLVLDARL